MRRDLDIRLVFSVIEQVVNIFGYDAFAVRTHRQGAGTEAWRG